MHVSLSNTSRLHVATNIDEVGSLDWWIEVLGQSQIQ